MSKLSRKDFLKRSVRAAAALPLLSFDWRKEIDFNATKDEAFWGSIRKLYRLDSEVINLNNGAVGPQPNSVQEAHINLYRESNKAPSYSMWEKVDSKRELLRADLASFLGCDTEELAINRNTTEGLATIIFGLDLKAGDEVIVSNYDYPFALNMWKQRAERDGIIVREVNLTLPTENLDEVVARFNEHLTDKTKVAFLTHILNWTGQIMPVKQLTELAQNRGCVVVLDAAHASGQVPFSFSDLGCDFAATSLHKWLGAPFGTGALMVRKSRIGELWSLHSAYEPKSVDIRKFEFHGTRSNAAEMAVLDALEFNKQIGAEAIHQRLKQLKNYWVSRLQDVSEITFHTSFSDEFSAAMATFSIDGKSGEEIADYLMESSGIHVGVIKWQDLDAIRISPHIFNSMEELDVLVSSVKKLVAQ